MGWNQWTADCSACSALCCVDFAFDAGEDFAHDKPAGEPCRHLSGHLCRLHKDLIAKGYPGCARYDCLGAGQRATALGGGFAALRRLHDDHLTLTAAGSLALSETAESARLSLLKALGAEGDHDLQSLDLYEKGPLPAEVRAFLKSLRALLPHR